MLGGSRSLQFTGPIVSRISNGPNRRLSNFLHGLLVFKFCRDKKTLSPSLKVGPSILCLFAALDVVRFR
jgi:hypothetical protein